MDKVRSLISYLKVLGDEGVGPREVETVRVCCGLEHSSPMEHT